VDRLLAKEPWLDAQFDGEARELLTRSAFERGADTTALSNARAALRAAKTADTRAQRLVLLARAPERNNQYDSAAPRTPRRRIVSAGADWLMLRAAGSETDSAKRLRCSRP
jgi:hypothetical protein